MTAYFLRPSLLTFHKHPEESGEVKVPEKAHSQTKGSAAVEEVTLKREKKVLFALDQEIHSLWVDKHPIRISWRSEGEETSF